ncbi:MAG: adenylosuccinate synthase [Bryobacterales bacterium]|nr:adenylosuccinate synthase [Bryobacterales bacterium]
MSNIIVLGAQWGDEGKGKIVDLFSESFDVIVRYQGGHNAGHTVYVGPRKFVLKLIPAGVLRPGKIAVIGNGLVVDPGALMAEIASLRASGVEVEKQLAISDRAHVIFPYHPLVEKLSEAREGRIAIGTTSRGIGPAYEDKVARRGLRVADLLDGDFFREAFKTIADDKQTVLEAFKLGDRIDSGAICAQYEELAEMIRPMVTDTALMLSKCLRDGKKVMFEGAQGTLLDIDHGTYPFVTSSNASAGGACTGAGVPPTCIDGIVGVSKAYITRVGGGPFPTEIHGEKGEEIRKAGKEFGAVTGRPRRCGWFDVPILKYTAAINGFDSLVLTKLDVLDGMKEIPVCTKYKLRGEELDWLPARIRDVEALEPVYETLPGWEGSTAGITRFEELPKGAQAYIEYLEAATGLEVGCVATGPEREQTIIRPGSKLAKLVGK